jgi:hypothetical protein
MRGFWWRGGGGSSERGATDERQLRVEREELRVEREELRVSRGAACGVVLSRPLTLNSSLLTHLS